MTLICFASQKGSPGTTVTALAVAAALEVTDGRRKLLLEADCTGGTLAIRYRLPVQPGLLTLAAAVRGEMDVEDLWRHCQYLPGGLPVVVCPDGPEQVHAAMVAGGAGLGRFLNGLREVDVICDAGRLAPGSPALDLVAEAGAVLMVARPTAEQLQPAARRMLMLRPQVRNLGWVLIGRTPYGPAEVEAAYDFPVVGVIADDSRSVSRIENGVMTRRLRRHPFIRSSATLASTLAEWLAPLSNTPDRPERSRPAGRPPAPFRRQVRPRRPSPGAAGPGPDRHASADRLPPPGADGPSLSAGAGSAVWRIETPARTVDHLDGGHRRPHGNGHDAMAAAGRPVSPAPQDPSVGAPAPPSPPRPPSVARTAPATEVDQTGTVRSPFPHEEADAGWVAP